VVDAIVRGSIWIGLAAFVLAHLGFRRAGPRRPSTTIAVYWLGAALLAVHVVAVFHWHHGWSHDHAVAATAAGTARVFGVDWGGGVWVNYAFLAGWIADGVRRTVAIQSPTGVTRFAWTVRAAAFVVIVNATIVFVPWPRSLMGVAIVVVLGAAWWPRRDGG
jgi:hypothetical protein